MASTLNIVIYLLIWSRYGVRYDRPAQKKILRSWPHVSLATVKNKRVITFRKTLKALPQNLNCNQLRFADREMLYYRLQTTNTDRKKKQIICVITTNISYTWKSVLWKCLLSCFYGVIVWFDDVETTVILIHRDSSLCDFVYYWSFHRLPQTAELKMRVLFRRVRPNTPIRKPLCSALHVLCTC